MPMNEHYTPYGYWYNGVEYATEAEAIEAKANQ